MPRWMRPLICAAVLGLATAAQAQVSITGCIAGTVMDNSDAVLPGATVNLRDEGTGVEKTTVTNDNGAFAFRDLNFGSYQVTVKSARDSRPLSTARSSSRRDARRICGSS